MPDVLLGETSKQPPALSATSDMPVIAKPTEETKQPEQTTETAKAETTTETTEIKTETKADEGTQTEKPADTQPKNRFQERIGEVVAQRKLAEDRANAAVEAANKATEALNKALSTIEQLSGKNAQTVADKVEQQDPRPQKDKFDTPDAYDAALTEWAVRQGTRAAFAKVEEDRLKQDTENKKKSDEEKAAKERADLETSNRKTFEEWTAKRNKAVEKYPDYAEVAERQDLNITMAIAHGIMASDAGPEIAYYLGQHPEEANRLAAVQNPVKLAIEIGKIEAKVLAPPKVEVSKLPKPITPLSSRNSATEKTIYDIGNQQGEAAMNEYAKRRNAQIAAERAERYGIPRKT